MPTQYGIYTDNMVTFGTFDKAHGNPLEDDDVLIKITTDIDGEGTGIHDRTTFKFEGNEILFSKEINESLSDPDINHAIEETKLDLVIDDSWTETFFYGIGNQKM